MKLERISHAATGNLNNQAAMIYTGTAPIPPPAGGRNLKKRAGNTLMYLTPHTEGGGTHGTV